MEKIKIAFLFDSSNNWIERYVRPIACNNSLAMRYSFFFSYFPDEIINFDVVFILGYTKILKVDFLKNNRLNLVVHESDLPEGKGFSPVQWQILEGKNEIPVCLIEAVGEVDSGAIYIKNSFILDGYELFDEIREKQAKATLDIIIKFLVDYPALNKKNQEGDSTYYSRRTNNDDELDIDSSIKDQFNHFRIADNEKYPLFFKINGRKYYLKIYMENQLSK